MPLLYDSHTLYDAHVTYDTGVAGAAFVAQTPIPALAEGQIELPNGLRIGPGTSYQIESIEGLDRVDARESDLPRGNADGWFAGRDYLERRTIRIKVAVVSSSAPNKMPMLLSELRRAFETVAAPSPMKFRLPNDFAKVISIMPRRLGWLTDGMSNVGGYSGLAAELVAADPLIRNAVEYGPSFLSASHFVSNGGSHPAKPRLVVLGPASGPVSITFGTQMVKVIGSIVSGSTMVIDFGSRSAVVTYLGATTDVYQFLDSASSWWEIPPCANLLSADQSSLETANAWQNASGATVARSAAQAAHGLYSVAITPSSTAEASASIFTSAAVSVCGGLPYTLVESWLAQTTPRSVFCRIAWKDSAGALISNSDGTPITTSTTAWQQSTLTATAPSNAVTALVVGVIAAGTAGQVQYLDRIGLSLGAVAAPWVPGIAQVASYGGGGTPNLYYSDTWV